MKIVFVFVIALCSFTYAFPKPASDDTEASNNDDPSSETEFVSIPLQKDQRRRPSFDVALPDVYNAPRISFGQDPFGQDPFYRGSSFGQSADDDFMTQMQDMLKEMRKQLTDLVKHAHEHGGVDRDVTSVGNRFGDSELPQNKTTSTTKVIDGHVVTVNETTYSSGDDSIGAVFRVKVVEIHPSEGPAVDDGFKTDEPTSSEIPNTENKSELDEDKHEETNEIPNAVPKVNYEWHPEFDPSFNEIDDQEDYSYQHVPPMKKENFYDLSDDTKVNDYISDQAMSQGLVMIDPDAELIDTNANSYYNYDRTPQRLQRFGY